MVEYLDRVGVRFWHSKKVVDYHPEIPGSARGRALEPQTFDGRTLGTEALAGPAAGAGVRAVRRDADGAQARGERAARDLRGPVLDGTGRGVLTALRLGVRWAADRLRYPRGTRLAMGNALVANLFHRLRERGAGSGSPRPRRGCSPRRGGSSGPSSPTRAASCGSGPGAGSVLAGGGFAASPDWRARYLPSPTPQYTRAGEGSTGDTLAARPGRRRSAR